MSTIALPIGRIRTRVRWEQVALLAILGLAALLCLWNLTENGYSNEYYAAAAKAGSESWKALFFGSLDPGSFITVDKPPLSLWLMGLSARVFGFSSFSILLPEALCTIAAVWLLYATVRRVFNPTAGLLAAAALALTPVTVAIGRVNNPDALLVLLMVASAYLVVRAIESGKTKQLAWAGALVGLAFMTKLLQGWMIAPALGAAYLLAGPPQLRVRIKQLAIAGVTMVAVSAAWPVAVSLWPGSKPYIGGSTNGSIWNLIFGYDGFGRLFGQGAGGSGGVTFGGAPGLSRMFNEQVGGQVAWLIPLAVIGLAAGLWITRRAPRTDRARAGWVLFGAWALVCVAVFSSQRGIFHPYYVSALAPAIAALAGAGVVTLVDWSRPPRRSWAGVAVLDVAIAGSASLAVVLLARTPSFAPALRTLIPIAAVVAIGASVAWRLGRKRALGLTALAAVVALLAGPASYSFANLGRSLSGNNVLAGPASVASSQGMGGGPGAFRVPGPRPGGPPRHGAQPTGMQAGGGQLSSTVIAYLTAHQGSAKYLFAASGSQTTAPVIIATGKAVVTIGGFNGSDPAPTVAQLAKLVAEGQLKYVLLSSGGGGGPGGGGTRQSIDSWVQAHGTKVTAVSVSGGTLYRVG